MSRFLLNPYDAPLDLSNKDDRKLYQEACKGLKDKDLFDRKRENYSNFIKLIKKGFTVFRLIDNFKINTQWDMAASTIEDQRIPQPEGIIDLFKSNKATKEQVQTHVDLVWDNSDFGARTPKYYATFPEAPEDTDELIVLRDNAKLEHVMMGAKL